MTNEMKSFVAALMGVSTLLGVALGPLVPVFAGTLLINAVCCLIVLVFDFGEWGR